MAVRVLVAVSSFPVALAVAAALRVMHVFASAKFSTTINLGAIIVGVLVVTVAGMFTVRSNVAKIWRENYEAEREKVRQLTEAAEEREAELLKQRELKHAALAEVQALKLTDQTAVLNVLAHAAADNRERAKEALKEVARTQEASTDAIKTEIAALRALLEARQ